MSYWLGPVFSKFLKIFINLMLSIHLFSCAYWRVKVSIHLHFRFIDSLSPSCGQVPENFDP